MPIDVVKSPWFVNLRKIHQARLLVSIREGFIAILPVMIIAAVPSLLIALLSLLPTFAYQDDLRQLFRDLQQLMVLFFPLAVVFSLSYQLSVNLQLQSISCSILACLCFLSHGEYLQHQGDSYLFTTHWITGYALLIPLLVPYLVKYLAAVPWLQLVRSGLLSPFLHKHLNLILPFLLTYFALFFLIPLLDATVQYVASWLSPQFSTLSLETQAFCRMLLIHLLWFVGIHGDNAFFSMFTGILTQQTFVAGLSLNSFYNHFVILGGSGCLLALVLAILLVRTSAQDKALAKVSLPFNFFNISEVVLYGLPVVFNPIFLLPFLLIPSLNFLLSYQLLQLGLIQFQPNELSWLTPMGLSGWLISGSWQVPLYQCGLLALDVLIYIPFVRLSQRLNDRDLPLQQVRQSLKFSGLELLDAEQRYAREQQHNQANQTALQHALAAIAAGQLQLHYQPKIELDSQLVTGFEALLRLKTIDGELQGPWFIDILERNQLVPLIDLWVVQQTASDLAAIQTIAPKPLISINLHPDSLSEPPIIKALLAIAQQYPQQLQLELLEHAMLEQQGECAKNLLLLRQQGILIAVDDFGRGFSNLSSLIQYRPDVVKLDRSLLLAMAQPEGLLLFQHLTQLCLSLGYQLTAEGVETTEQLALIRKFGVRYAQGWLFAKALPLEQAIKYQPDANIWRQPSI